MFNIGRLMSVGFVFFYSLLSLIENLWFWFVTQRKTSDWQLVPLLSIAFFCQVVCSRKLKLLYKWHKLLFFVKISQGIAWVFSFPEGWRYFSAFLLSTLTYWSQIYFWDSMLRIEPDSKKMYTKMIKCALCCDTLICFSPCLLLSQTHSFYW